VADGVHAATTSRALSAPVAAVSCAYESLRDWPASIPGPSAVRRHPVTGCMPGDARGCQGRCQAPYLFGFAARAASTMAGWRAMPFAATASSSAMSGSSTFVKLKQDLPCLRLRSAGDIEAISSGSV